MSLSDPKTIKCIACGKEQAFKDGTAILSSEWDCDETTDGEPLDLCGKCRRKKSAIDKREAIRNGAPYTPPGEAEGPTLEDLVKEDEKMPVQASQGLKIYAQFKLVNVYFSLGRDIIHGDIPPEDALELEIKNPDVLKELSLGRDYVIKVVK